MDVSLRNDDLFVTLQEIMYSYVTFVTFCLQYLSHCRRRRGRRFPTQVRRHYSLLLKIPKQVNHLHDIIGLSDTTCLNHLRMSRNAFAKLCQILEHSGGLTSNRNVSVSEQVAMFVSILAHHTKNRIVKDDYKRSGRTVSKHFNSVLNAIIKCHSLLLVDPEPVAEDCTIDRWKLFKGCLGALDGTYIRVKVLKSETGHYRNRKGEITVNVLAACDRNMNFIYILSGWEGSASDSRVLRDAVTRPNGLRVPRGKYYLCDNGYTNGDGFLTPYRGVRYHLDEWGEGTIRPQNKEEFFNMKHSKARNIIERAFGLLKTRWAILRSPSYYPIKVQNQIIMACCLLHNFIRKIMPFDPLENEVLFSEDPEEVDMDDYVDIVEPSQQWTSWRDNLANSMYQEWRGVV